MPRWATRRPSDNQEVGAEVTSDPQAPSRVTKCPACVLCPPGPARRLSGSTRGARGHRTHFPGLESSSVCSRPHVPVRQKVHGRSAACHRSGLASPSPTRRAPRALAGRARERRIAAAGARRGRVPGTRVALTRHVRVCPASSREPPSSPASHQCSTESFRNRPGPQSSTTPPGSGDDRPLRGCRLAATLVARSRLSRHRV